jgi:hypothetical protein
MILCFERAQPCDAPQDDVAQGYSGAYDLKDCSGVHSAEEGKARP